MNIELNSDTVMAEAVAAMVKLGFDASHADHMIRANAQQLRLVLPALTEEAALLREAAATLIRFGEVV
jgi:Holliday junction resolvasome RuvABC DNA-binding subunit